MVLPAGAVVKSWGQFTERQDPVMRQRSLPIAALALLALCLALFQPVGAARAAQADSFRVVAYYPSWRSASHQEKIDYDTVTHVIYAFAIPTAEGGLMPLENPNTAKQLIANAHAAGAKVLLAVGGWSYGDQTLESTFVSATSTPARRTAFADAILKLCDTYGFDGVDIDWEYPRLAGNTYKQYEALILDLADRLHRQGKLLTTAVMGGTSPQGVIYANAAAYTDKVLEAVDWINIMAYDGDNGSQHSTYEYAVHAASYWLDTRGMPREKVVLGVPFYARPGGTSYATLVAEHPSAALTDSLRHKGMQVWYNGPATITAKTEYALERLGGVMIWEITQDTTNTSVSLLAAIAQAIAEYAPFRDVPARAWYRDDVYTAATMGLMQGTGSGYFTPLGNVTVAQAIALSVRLHLRSQGESDALVQGKPWYQVYVDYALDAGILTEQPAKSELDRAITRGEFAALLARSLPEEELEAINTVTSIPDVSKNDPYADAIYQLYRAGVFQGADGTGAFQPERTITRAETAAVVCRMADSSLRLSFTLKK